MGLRVGFSHPFGSFLISYEAELEALSTRLPLLSSLVDCRRFVPFSRHLIDSSPFWRTFCRSEELFDCEIGFGVRFGVGVGVDFGGGLKVGFGVGVGV